jgi:dynactin complex subunit
MQTNAEKSVSIKVQAKTKELEETINALEQKVKNRTIEMQRLSEELNRFI